MPGSFLGAKLARMCIRWLLVFVAAYAMSGCAANRLGVITPSDVNASIASWQGRVVKVSGVVAFESHARHLWTMGQSRDHVENCLTLINTVPLQSRLTRLNGRRATITGVVIPNTWTDADGSSIVDIGSCNRIGLLVRSIDR